MTAFKFEPEGIGEFKGRKVQDLNLRIGGELFLPSAAPENLPNFRKGVAASKSNLSLHMQNVTHDHS
jgi:hypothetical protein